MQQTYLGLFNFKPLKNVAYLFLLQRRKTTAKRDRNPNKTPANATTMTTRRSILGWFDDDKTTGPFWSWNVVKCFVDSVGCSVCGNTVLVVVESFLYPTVLFWVWFFINIGGLGVGLESVTME